MNAGAFLQMSCLELNRFKIQFFGMPAKLTRMADNSTNHYKHVPIPGDLKQQCRIVGKHAFFLLMAPETKTCSMLLQQQLNRAGKTNLGCSARGKSSVVDKYFVMNNCKKAENCTIQRPFSAKCLVDQKLINQSYVVKPLDWGKLH